MRRSSVSTPTSTRSCFARCALRFVDPAFELINGKLFACGARVKVEMGFHTRLMPVFDGEVVAVEPRFLRDKPPSLRVVYLDGLHRFALSQMTRTLELSPPSGPGPEMVNLFTSSGLRGEKVARGLARLAVEALR
jgi:hypothetical protein